MKCFIVRADDLRQFVNPPLYGVVLGKAFFLFFSLARIKARDAKNKRESLTSEGLAASIKLFQQMDATLGKQPEQAVVQPVVESNNKSYAFFALLILPNVKGRVHPCISQIGDSFANHQPSVYNPWTI